MKEFRLKKILKSMERAGISQILITDPAAIFYVTGKWIEPGERFLGMYINKNNAVHKIFINRLFTVPDELGMDIIWYSDTDDITWIVSQYTNHELPLGVDKVLPARFLLPLMKKQTGTSFENISFCIDEVRACKDSEEQEKMRAASLVNDQAMNELIQNVKVGITEIELAQELDKIYKKLGAEGYSFQPLIGFGANAAVGHHEPDHSILQEGNCILIDIGCKKDSYCSDMTRTFFYKHADPKYQEIYEIVKSANEKAEALIKPGVCIQDIDNEARAAITKAGYGEYFTHRLGHFIGIEVHEAGDISQSNLDILRPGMIFSIEPGIYLPDQVGVRIEDLVLVTEDGYEVLNHFSKDLKILP